MPLSDDNDVTRSRIDQGRSGLNSNRPGHPSESSSSPGGEAPHSASEETLGDTDQPGFASAPGVPDEPLALDYEARDDVRDETASAHEPAFGESLFDHGPALAIASLCVAPLTLLVLISLQKIPALNALSHWGWYLLGGMVLLSAALVTADAFALRAAHPRDWRVPAPLSVLGMVSLFWPITYPNYLFDRSKIVGPHLGLWAIPSVLCALFCLRYIPDRQLPACDSPAVIPLVERAVRDAGLVTGDLSIDGHRELVYREQTRIRVGECSVRSAGATLVVQYAVKWFEERGEAIAVEAWAKELPACNAVETIRMVAEMVQSTRAYGEVTGLTGWRQDRFDEVEDRRWGSCLAQTPQGDLPVRFTVEWSNRVEGEWQTRLWPAIPPACDSDVTRALLRRFFEPGDDPPGPGQQLAEQPQFENLRELDFDRVGLIRSGECTVRWVNGATRLRFELFVSELRSEPRFDLRILGTSN